MTRKHKNKDKKQPPPKPVCPRCGIPAKLPRLLALTGRLTCAFCGGSFRRKAG